MAAVDVNDLSIEELRARVESTRGEKDRVFQRALVDKIERQALTIRELFADVMRLSMTREAEVE
jgi:hypothetical protein